MAAGSRTLFNKVKRFWREVMNDESVNIQYRLKASELCMKLEEESEEGAKVVIITGEEALEGGERSRKKPS